MSAPVRIDAVEARVLGVLVEKDLTTPEQYPLTLNAATNGANQKNNRAPVLELEESAVLAALQKLIIQGLVGSVHPVGARVEKFRHNAQAFFALERPQLAVLAELLLRGPQQPGELRGRASRMAPIDSLPALGEVLKPLLEAGLVVRLDPAPGTRAERYAQTLAPAGRANGGGPAIGSGSAIESRPTTETRPAAGATATPAALAPANASAAMDLPPASSSGSAGEDDEIARRIAELEFNVSRLRRQLDNLAWKLGEKLEG